jgi:hypothetical protein
VLVNEELTADYVRCPVKLVPPEIVREDDDRTSAGISIIRLFDEAAQSGADSEHREIAARDDFGSDRFRIAVRREIHLDFSAAEDAVEEASLLLEVTVHRVRHQVPGAESTADLFAFPIDQHEMARITDGEGVENYLIDQRVDGGGGADA